MRLLPRLFRLLPLPAALLLGGGCSSAAFTSYNDELGGVFELYRAGRLERAAEQIEKEHRDDWELKIDAEAGTMSYGRSAVLWNLERGKILMDAGRFRQAFQALEDAETVINRDFEERAALSARDALGEAGSALSNQKALEYRAYVHDRVMLNAYKALCMLAAGDLEAALVEARRVQEAQERALREWRDEAAAADRAAAQRRMSIDYAGLMADAELRRSYPDFRGADRYPPGYNDFVNPYATLVVGLTRRIKNSSAEDPEVDFRNLASMLPDNEYLRAEWQATRDGRGPEGSVWVLFENGVGPYRESQEIQVPYGLFRLLAGTSRRGTNLFKSAFLALPVLRRGGPAAQALTVRGGGPAVTTQAVSDMYLVELFEFEQRFPSVLLREALRVLVQETAAHELAERAHEQDEVLGVVAVVGSFFYKLAANRADDRAWKTVGGEFQVARLDLPPDLRLELRLQGGGAAPLVVDLPDEQVVVLLVRSVNPDHLSCHATGFSPAPRRRNP